MIVLDHCPRFGEAYRHDTFYPVVGQIGFGDWLATHGGKLVQGNSFAPYWQIQFEKDEDATVFILKYG
jgi:hypothetical protein